MFYYETTERKGIKNTERVTATPCKERKNKKGAGKQIKKKNWMES